MYLPIKNFNDYYIKKILMCIIFCYDKIDFNSELINLFKDTEYLFKYKQIIIELTDMNALNYQIKNNVYNSLMDIRNIDDDMKSDRIKIIHDIIGIVNLQTKDQSEKYYFDTLISYTHNNTLKFKKNRFTYKMLEDFTTSMIYNDITVLSSHIDILPEEDIDKYQNNLSYYMSINKILEEFPDICNDLYFLNNTQIILSNSKIDKNAKALINKKILKKINNI